MENLFYRFVLFVCKFWQARDLVRTEARDLVRTEVRIMCLRRGGLRHWGYFERTHGANKCIYRQILNKK